MNKKIIKLLLVIIAIFSIGNCYVQDVDTSNSKKTLITNVNKITDNSYVALTKEVKKKKFTILIMKLKMRTVTGMKMILLLLFLKKKNN